MAMADENLGWQPDDDPAIGNSRLAKAVRAFDEAVQSGQTDLSGPVSPSTVFIAEPAAPVQQAALPQERLDKLEAMLQQLATVVSTLAHYEPPRSPKARQADDRLLRRVDTLEAAMTMLQASPTGSKTQGKKADADKAAREEADAKLHARLDELEDAIALVLSLDTPPPATVAPESETKMLSRLGGLEVAVAQLQTGESTPMHGLTALVEQMGTLEAAMSALTNRLVAIEAEQAVVRARSDARPRPPSSSQPDMHRVQDALRRLRD
jgi:hypothetical protein